MKCVCTLLRIPIAEKEVMMGNECSFKVFPGQNEGKQEIVEGLGNCRRGATKWLFLGFRDSVLPWDFPQHFS